MSGFLMVTGGWAERLLDEQFSKRIVASMLHRGTDLSRSRAAEGAVVVAVQHAWEAGLAATSKADEPARHLVAADASLYYLGTLGTRLGGRAIAAGESATDLIAQAFAAFGPDCLKYLEGDFAFAAWDPRTGEVFAARDPFGTRSLYHAALDGAFAIASVPHPLRILLGDPELSRRELIRSVTGYHGDGTGSPWKGISELPGGWQLVGRGSTAPRVSRYWYPHRVPEWTKAPSPEAALILRDLIANATRERMPATGAAVGMSGGRDSTAMVGSVEWKRRSAAESSPNLTILSYRYPGDDPGNEDIFVNQIASLFGYSVDWIESNRVPVFQNAVARADRRVRPEAQPFEGLNRALAAATRQHGLRVVLNGNGGDNVFALPDFWLADLFRTGKWMQLASELRARRYPGKSWLQRTCVRPAIPLFVQDGAEFFLGRRLIGRPWERHPPSWLVKGVLEREGIVDEDRAGYRRDIASFTSSVGRRARLWALLYAGFAQNNAALFDMTLDEGVELRMPFYDTRVVNFAWSRPSRDLNDGVDNKVILRESMKGLLPADVLAVRRQRTGTSNGYFLDCAKREFGAFARPLLTDSLLAELGIIEPLLLGADIESWNSAAPTQQLLTVICCSVESWVRAHI